MDKRSTDVVVARIVLPWLRDFVRVCVCVYVTFRAYYFLGMPFLRQGTCSRIQATSDYYASFACSYEISIVRVE